MRQMMKRIVISGGAFAPIFVFTLHLLASRVFGLYEIWPPTDVPMHFLGGVSIAFFVSRSFQLLPRESVKRSRIVLLELLLIGTLTATTAVFWEFAEFTLDQLAGTNVQVSLANTMQDLAMGVLGASLIILVRAKQLNLGKNELQEIGYEWVQGQAA